MPQDTIVKLIQEANLGWNEIKNEAHLEEEGLNEIFTQDFECLSQKIEFLMEKYGLMIPSEAVTATLELSIANDTLMTFLAGKKVPLLKETVMAAVARAEEDEKNGASLHCLIKSGFNVFTPLAGDQDALNRVNKIIEKFGTAMGASKEPSELDDEDD